MTPRRCVLVLLFATLAAGSAGAAAQADVAGSFPVPARMQAFADAPTPRDYSQLEPLIAALPLGQMVSPTSPVGLGTLDLGALGQGHFVGFEFECGSENCPMAIFVQHGASFQRVFFEWGAGIFIGPSGGPVPYIYGRGHSSCCDHALTRFRYNGSQYVADGCDLVRNTMQTNSSPRVVSVAPCQPGGSAFVVPPLASAPSVETDAYSPVVYAALRPLLSKELARLPAGQREAALEHVRIVAFPPAAAVQMPNCDALGNCPIVVFGGSGDQFRAVLRATGTAIALLETFHRPFRRWWVIRRRLASGETELVRYHSVPEQPPQGYRGTWPQPFAPWTADVCELVHGATVDPVYCANAAPVANGRGAGGP